MKVGAVPKKEPLQDGYSGKVPTAGITGLEWEAAGIMHGTATLTLYIKDGQLTRYTTSRERSIVPGKTTSGGLNGE